MRLKNLPFVSIIILNYNGKKHLKELFESLNTLDYPKNKFEIIMGDNASSDNSIEYVQEIFPWVKVIKFNKNYGFAEGNNKLVDYTRKNSNFLIFLNNDVIVDKNLILGFIDNLEKDILCMGGKILLYPHKNIIDSAGDQITIIGTGFGRGHLEKDEGLYDRKCLMSGISGALFFIDKKLFIKMEGFDVDYFAYAEDIDLCWRLWLNNYKILYTPASVIYHKGGGSFGSSRNLPNRLFLGQRNRLYNILKNVQTINLPKAFFISTSYDLFRFMKFFILFNFLGIFSILKGYLHFF